MKTIHSITLLCTIAICTNSFAQVSINWQSDVGANRDEGFKKICISNDGGFLAAGTSGSNTSRFKTEPSRGGHDYWVIKYDANGQIVWDKTIGGNKDDILFTAISTKDNGYLLAGSSSSDASGEKTSNSYGFADYWLVKLDAVGNIQWDKTIGSEFSEVVVDANETNDGGYILLGDLGLTKTDNLGNVQWQNPALSTVTTFYRSVQQTKKGDYVLGGDTLIFNGQVFFYPSLLKTDEFGNPKSRRFFTGLATDNASHQALVMKDQSILIFGIARVDQSKSYQFAIDVLKLDKHANQLWRYTSNEFDSFYIQTPVIVQPDKNGDYIFGGGYQPKDESGGNPDYIIGKIDSLGNKKWQCIIRGDNVDEFGDLKIKGTNHYIVGGTSVSGEGEDKTKPGLGNGDYWIVSAFDTTSNNIALTTKSSAFDNTKSSAIIFYPNPAKNILHIQSTVKATITLINQSGKIILTTTLNGNKEINVSHLPAGLYYLKNTETSAVQKLIITK